MNTQPPSRYNYSTPKRILITELLIILFNIILIWPFDKEVLWRDIKSRERGYKSEWKYQTQWRVIHWRKKRQWVCDDPTQYKTGPNNMLEQFFHKIGHHLGDYNTKLPIWKTSVGRNILCRNQLQVAHPLNKGDHQTTCFLKECFHKKYYH